MLWMWVGAVVIAVVGTLAHFLYDMTQQNKIVGLFAAVNESTWEHIKIALTPTILWSLVDGIWCGENPNYFVAKLASLMVLIVFIPLMFYSYKAVVKRSIVVVDILIFYLVILLSQCAFWAIIELPAVPFCCQYLAVVGTFVVFGAYTLLTLMPLKTFIFKDPITKKYGFSAHSDKFNIFKKRKKK